MPLIKALENYGLTKKQAKTYLACLELGLSSVQRISQRANLPRSTCYEALESLRKKGLMSTFRKKGIKCFSAETPKKIIDEAQRKTELLKDTLPQLQAIENRAGTQPSIRFYQGKEGIKTVLKEMLKEAHEVFAFSSAEDIFAILEDYFPKFVQQRIKRKTPMRVILRDSPKARERKRLGPQELRKVKIIPAEYEHHGVIVVWNHKIAMFSLKEQLEVVVIESKDLTAVQKASFDFIWNSLPD